jgi:hypothetical protein
MDGCYENRTSRRFRNLADSGGAGKSEPAKCSQRAESAPLAEIQEFGQSLRSQIHISLTIVSPARNTDRLGFVFLGNDH